MRVLKFGGTSVADADAVRRVVAIVASERRTRPLTPRRPRGAGRRTRGGGVGARRCDGQAARGRCPGPARRRHSRAGAGGPALHAASRDPGDAGARRAWRARCPKPSTRSSPSCARLPAPSPSCTKRRPDRSTPSPPSASSPAAGSSPRRWSSAGVPATWADPRALIVDRRELHRGDAARSTRPTSRPRRTCVPRSTPAA